MLPIRVSQAQAHARSGAWRHLRVRDPESAKWESFPDFLILGPQRTGTTWLYHNLKKHPQIFLPRQKETYFFTTLGKPGHDHFEFEYLDDFLAHHLTETPRQWMKRHYDSLRHCHEWYRPAARGEATATNALLAPAVIRELLDINPDLKVILMLRDPVERAWSHARKDLVRKFQRRPEEVPETEFAKFFRASGQRGLASYAGLLSTWTTELKPGHVFVGDFEMIAKTPEELLTGLHRFLGIRHGPRYFNRHLEERINPAASGGESRVPDFARQRLSDLLSEEIGQYEALKRLFDLPPSETGTLREKFAFRPVAVPRFPVIDSESTGSDRRPDPV